MFSDNQFVKGIKKLIKDLPYEYKKFKAFFKETYNKRIIYMYIIDALVVTMLIEMLARHSFIEGIYYLISSPYVIICNAMIILITLSVTLLMRRRIFGMAIITIIWIGFGITNSVLLSYRVTPLTAVDLILIDSAIDIMNKYVSAPVYVLIVLLIIGAIAGLVYVWKKIPKVNHKIKIPRNIGAIAIIVAMGMGAINLGLSSKLLSTKFGNLADSYKEYGFVYCFVNSLINTGVDKPDDYSDKTINNLKNEEIEEKKVKTKPNIIFLQLESFFDVNKMKNFKFSENPLPTFTELKEKYPHGYLNVPIVGAGTVNTEFEVMTGMNIDDFGPGEIPFKTSLVETTCESVCFNLKNYGYKCHAIHNNTATFYGRNVVFSNLGYDTFTSIENMHIVEKTPMDWAKDFYLTDAIMETLKSTKKKKDFIYTISVQGHGSYPSDEADYPFKIEGLEDDEDRRYSFEYYVSQINEMDTFLKELTEALEAYDEKTILVLYGDHLPSLGISEEELVNEDVYQTEYIIWSNFDAGYESENIEAYELQAKILSKLNMTAGYINSYSQTHRNDEDQEEYLSGLKNMEYDMLYGDQLLYEGTNPFVATDLKFGLKEVTVTSVSPMYDEEGKIYIYGKNFTTYSKVYVNEEKQSTEYIDESTLLITYPDLEQGDSFSVYQQNSDTHVLTQTEPLVYENENLGKVESETETEPETTTKAKKKNKNKKNNDK